MTIDIGSSFGSPLPRVRGSSGCTLVRAQLRPDSMRERGRRAARSG
jgi:hypothetical protein